jgi:hypothetical protein
VQRARARAEKEACVALRKLFAVAIVLGGSLAVGCGGASGKSAYDPDADQEAPNTAGDHPPNNAGDSPSADTDRPPSNTDRPASNPDAVGGGRLKELCNKLCELVDRCSSGTMMDESMDLADVCANDGCNQIPPGAEAQIPCLQESLDLFDCILGLPNLCLDEDTEQGGAEVEVCSDAVKASSDCAEQNAPPTMRPDDDNPPAAPAL